MVALYVGGNRVGTMAEAEELFVKFAARNQSVELRDDAGLRIGRFIPDAEPICPWEPKLTQEEIDLRCEQPTKTWAEIRAGLGEQ